MKNDGEFALLEARLSDALARADRGEVSFSPFLTPRERRAAVRWAQKNGCARRLWFWGGYPDAERVCACLLPDYLADALETTPEDADPDAMLAMLGDDLTDAVTAVRVSGSGYAVLGHRDYLGSVMGLGVERDAIGDLCAQNDREAVIFCTRAMADFFLENLTKVGNDTVRCAPYLPDGNFTDGRKYQPISDTVASERLDCVIAALTNLSRADAQTLIRSGAVDVDFDPVDATDFTLSVPATLSVRGYGRFILRSFDGETRKGRLRMKAEKLV